MGTPQKNKAAQNLSQTPQQQKAPVDKPMEPVEYKPLLPPKITHRRQSSYGGSGESLAEFVPGAGGGNVH